MSSDRVSETGHEEAMPAGHGRAPGAERVQVGEIGRPWSPAGMLSLQRRAGNRAVGAVLARQVVQRTATTANHHLAVAIDAFNAWDDAALRKRHSELAWQAFRERDQRALEAVEYVAHARGLSAPLPAWPDRSSVRSSRADWRWSVEKDIRRTRSFKKAADPVSTMDAVKDLKAEAEAFKPRFTEQARSTALDMLAESERALGPVVRSYGLPVNSFRTHAMRVARGAEPDAEADVVIEVAVKLSSDVDKQEFQDKREDLARTVKELKQLQAEHDLNEQRRGAAGPAEWQAARATEAQSQKRLELRWLKAQRAHPVLASYLRGEPLHWTKLGSLDTDEVELQMKTVVRRLFAIYTDIAKARWMLRDPKLALTLPPVVALTSERMFIPPGSIRAGVVNDLAEEAKADRSTLLLMLAAIAIAVITSVPSGGTSLALPGAMASIALGTYSATLAKQRYDRVKTLSGTALEQAKALIQEAPSLAGFVMDLIGIGLDMLTVGKIARAAFQVRRLVLAGQEIGDAANALNRLGADAGLGNHNLADDVIQATRGERAAARTAAVGTSEPGSAWTHEQMLDLFTRAFRRPGPTQDALVFHKTRADFEAVARALGETDLRGLAGFYNRRTKKIHLPPEAKTLTVMHEALHFAGHQSGVKAILGSYVNEGLTDWLARLEFGPHTGRQAYDPNVAFVVRLASVVGEDTLRNAFLHRQWAPLRAKLVARLGSEENVQTLYHLLRQVGPEGQKRDALRDAVDLLWPRGKKTPPAAPAKQRPAAVKGATEDTWRTKTPKPPGEQRGGDRSVTPQSPLIEPLTLSFARRDEVHQAVKDVLSALGSSRPPGWPNVYEALRLVPRSLRARILARLENVMGALQNRKWYADVLTDAWQRVRDRTAADINDALRQMADEAGLSVVTVKGPDLLNSDVFFTEVVAKPASWIDKALTGDPHGEMTHLLQDLVVDRALGAGKSAAFRVLLGQAKGRIRWDSALFFLPNSYTPLPNRMFTEGERSIAIGDYVWRFTYDLYYPRKAREQFARLPQPELVKPKFEALGLE